MLGISEKAFNFKQTCNKLKLHDKFGDLNLFKKHTGRTPFIQNSFQDFFGKNAIGAAKSRLVSDFYSISKRSFSNDRLFCSIDRPFDGLDEPERPDWKLKNSRTVALGPSQYQRNVEEMHIGEYRGSQICTRKLSATDLERLTVFIGNLSASSRNLRFSGKSDYDIAILIVANALKGAATYISLVDDERDIVGLADLWKVSTFQILHRYWGEIVPGAELIKTCQFKIVVGDQFQGLGLGRKLYQLVMQEARNARYDELYAEIKKADKSRTGGFLESVGMKKWRESDEFIHYCNTVD